jgi:hypothetical protein
MVSIIAATSLIALNLSVASPAAGACEGAVDAKLLGTADRTPTARLAHRSHRADHHPAAPQAAGGGGDRLAAGPGQDHLRAAERPEPWRCRWRSCRCDARPVSSFSSARSSPRSIATTSNLCGARVARRWPSSANPNTATKSPPRGEFLSAEGRQAGAYQAPRPRRDRPAR